MDIKVEIKGLKKHFGKTKAVDNIDFAFESGNTYAFIGPNGAGKTTTMRLIATMDLPTAGDITINDISVFDFPDVARELIGFVPDALPSIKNITVHEYIDFFARAYGLKGKRRDNSVKDVEEFTGLDKFQDKTLAALSKGMKQRVCLGRALIHDPPILIMDEPAAGLDPRARVELRELIALLTEQGKAILISSHILTELTDICNGAIIIEKGKVIHCGDYESILDTGLSLNGKMNKNGEKIKITNIRIKLLHDAEKLVKELLTLPKIYGADTIKNEVILGYGGNEQESAELLASLIKKGYLITEFRKHKSSLEDAFMNLTKGELQ
ncbi:MAG: ABC transporter ATP-binding protein [Verrucomicrobiota bacterium]|nr:ABC transporter ATP-binding protein [Verrucomicrobiota bacterium]